MKNAAGRRAALLGMLIVSIAIGSTAAAQPLTPPWTNTDIGNPAITGSAAQSGGAFTINAAGADIWGSADQFHFVFQPVTGDVEIVAQVVSLATVDRWSKAGVMIRESLAADSRHAMMIASVSKGYAFQRRLETGGLSVHTQGPGSAPPGWVRLIRTGDVFTAYQSPNGTTWTLVGSETIAMGATVYVGLPVTSHNALSTVTAKLDNVKVTPAAEPTNGPPAVSITAPVSNTGYSAPASIGINAAAIDPEGAMLSVDFYADQVLLDRDTTAPYSTTWSIATPGTYSLTAVAHDADGGSTTSAAVRVTVFNVIPPTVTLTSPADGATFIAPATIAASAAASDPDGQIARVEFYSGTTRLATDSTAPYSYSWANVPAGSYNISAVAYDNSGASTTSAVSSITVGPSTPLPAGQQSIDVGRPAVSGRASYLDGVYTIRGAGVDIWGTADQFQFVYQQAAGDIEIVAHVAGLTNTSAWAKAGVMIRESLDAGSPQAFALLSAAKGHAFQRRLQTGGISVHTPGSDDGAPGWARLVRTGNLFEAYESRDGTTWTLLGSDTIQMAATIYVGLAVTSHNSGLATTATIDGLRLTELTANQPPSVVLTAPGSGATFTAPATINLAAIAADPENQLARVEFYSGTTLLGTDTSAPYEWTWNDVAAGTYALTAKAYDSAGAVATSGVATVIVSNVVLPPRLVVFGASVDHATNVASYLLEVFASGADPGTATPLVSSDLGKPTPDATNDITADQSTLFTNLPVGNYVATVTAIGPGGRTRGASVTFTR